VIALPLVRGWDAALTYSSINEEPTPGEGPFFVGRETLLGSLVEAISEPDLRGTYLISGYRGAGKTSLVIEAARRAKPVLNARAVKLLPLVLNVSEVSASLDTPEDVEQTPQLRIDARRVITALLRALRNEVADKEIARQIGEAYEKATATEYTETLQRKAEATHTRTVQRSSTLAVANLIKFLSALAAVAAVVLGVAWLGESAAIPVAMAALAGVAVFGFTWARTTERKTVQTDVADRQLKSDNSLHQIETDLRDILAKLHAGGFRTMFVLEELDKITDDGGEQLKDVIRYFKNLFTQAPALFFFLTDKQYFDAVDTKIATARREGSYAVEHTFFTQRIFVTRPSLEECLDYFAQVIPEAGVAIAAIRETQGARVRRVHAMSVEERFLRRLLFSAQNHLFDLKAQMRGYVRVGPDGSRLEFDETGVTAADDGIVVCQFLLEQKARLYRFDGGRDYANETLRNCLARVVTDFGGEGELVVAALYPEATGSEITRTERRRIIAAIDSLLGELERGRAIERQQDGFRWREDAAANFAPIPDLEPNEKALVRQLERALRVARSLDSPLELDFRSELEAVQASEHPLPAEETQRRIAELHRQLAPELEHARTAHRAALTAAGWELTDLGGGAYAANGGPILSYAREFAPDPDVTDAAVVFVSEDEGDPVPQLSPGNLSSAIALKRPIEDADAELTMAQMWRNVREQHADVSDDAASLWLPGAAETRYESRIDAVRAWIASGARRLAVAGSADWLMGAFAQASPGLDRPVLLWGPGPPPGVVRALLDRGRLVFLDDPNAPRSVLTQPHGTLNDVAVLRLSDEAAEHIALAALLGPGDERSWQLYETAAERGDLDAMAKLLERDPDKWFTALVASGDWPNVRRVADSIPNESVARQLLAAAASGGDVPALVKLATDPAEAKRASEWGDRLIAARAWAELTVAAYDVADEALGLRWLERAANADFPNAMIGAMIRAVDPGRAHYWEERIIASGDELLIEQAAEQATSNDSRQRLLSARTQPTS
jgi:hypothetical protein